MKLRFLLLTGLLALSIMGLAEDWKGQFLRLGTIKSADNSVWANNEFQT